MSDEDDIMQDSDQEDYDFEYEDDDDQDTGDVGIENKYYNAKQIKGEHPQEAIDEFLGIPPMEAEKAEWGFKGLKQAIKLEFGLKKYSSALEHYEQLLTYVKSAVTRNYSEKSINKMLDFVEKNADDEEGRRSIEVFYSKTLQSLSNDRLWLKTNIKLARLWLDQKDYRKVSEKLKELHKACQKPDGSDDPSKGAYALEIFALEIAMYAETRNNKRLKLLYQRALRVKSAVPHPHIMGIIRECGGKMHMSEENWTEAQSDFFEAFRNYDEAGSLQRIQVLKYLVLCTMLMGSDINPFDSPETKAYQNDPRISAMTDMVYAYQTNDIDKYESILAKNPDLTKDPFIAENIEEVTRSIRTNSILKIVTPYSRFSLDFISRRLRITVTQVQEIIAFLILDGRLNARIDQATGIVTMKRGVDAERIQAVGSLTTEINKLWDAILKSSEPRAEDPSMPIALSASDQAFSTGKNYPMNRRPRRAAPAPAMRKMYTGD